MTELICDPASSSREYQSIPYKWAINHMRQYFFWLLQCLPTLNVGSSYFVGYTNLYYNLCTYWLNTSAERAKNAQK